MARARERAHVRADLGEHDLRSSGAKPGDLLQAFDDVAKGHQFSLDSSVEHSNGFLQLLDRPQMLSKQEAVMLSHSARESLDQCHRRAA